MTLKKTLAVGMSAALAVRASLLAPRTPLVASPVKTTFWLTVRSRRTR